MIAVLSVIGQKAAASGTSVLPWVLLALATVAGLVLPRVLGKRACAQRRWLRTHQELADANGLTASEARVLWRIGIGAGLDNPALVFVRPTLFESRAQMLQIDSATVASIRTKVFGS